jgi:prevent-host-death family protein
MTNSGGIQVTLSVDTSQMKAQLSEFIGRVAFGRERLLVLRRGKPVAALVSVEDLRQLEVADRTQVATEKSAEHPIMKVYGRWAGEDDWDAILEEIYADRLASTGREIEL